VQTGNNRRVIVRKHLPGKRFQAGAGLAD